MLNHHEDAELFREAVRLTQTQTGFAARLIEKDYFCSMLLYYLTQAVGGLVFKGGTCLAKVHVGFYRLSEDLDYAVRKLGVRPDATELMQLVRQKLAVPGNEPADVSDRRLATLRQQVEPQLKPVLRANDFSEFDLDRAFRMVAEMATHVC